MITDIAHYQFDLIQVELDRHSSDLFEVVRRVKCHGVAPYATESLLQVRLRRMGQKLQCQEYLRLQSEIYCDCFKAGILGVVLIARETCGIDWFGVFSCEN